MKATRYFSPAATLSMKEDVEDDAPPLNPDNPADDWRLKGSLEWPAGVDPFAPLPSSAQNANSDDEKETDEQYHHQTNDDDSNTQSPSKNPADNPSHDDLHPDVEMAECQETSVKRARTDDSASQSELASKQGDKENDRKRPRLEEGHNEDEETSGSKGSDQPAISADDSKENGDSTKKSSDKKESTIDDDKKTMSVWEKDEVEIIDYEAYHCSVCDLYFRSLGEKCAHDFSKAHKLKQMVEEELIKAGNGEEETEADSTDSDGVLKVELPQQPDGEWGDPLTRIDAFMVNEIQSIGEIEVPESFKSWAQKSIAAAAAQVETDGDATLLGFVRKEVTFELLRHCKHCTLFRFNWNRMELATGHMMKQGGVVLPIVSKRKAEAKEQSEGSDVKTEDAGETVKDEVIVKDELTTVKIEDCLVEL